MATEADLDRIERIIAEGERRLARFRQQVEADRARGTVTWMADEVLRTHALALSSHGT